MVNSHSSFSKRVISYWLIAWLFNVIVVEMFVSGILMGGPFFSSTKLIITLVIYYAILSLIFALILEYIPKSTVILIFFVYGVLFELLIAKTIQSLGEFIGFGLLYIAMFSIPLWIRKKFVIKAN